MAQANLQTDSPIQVNAEEENISFEKFLKKYDGVRAEWVKGNVEVQGSNNTIHQDVLGFLYLLLKAFLSFKPVGRVLLAGVVMYLGDDKPGRQPDRMIVLNEHLDRIQPTRVNGAADIVIEIVSLESVERDYGKKFVEYKEAGIPEYWLFDPVRKIADIYVLSEAEEEGTKTYRYHRAKPDEKGRLVSPHLPGFAFDPTVLWLDVQPDFVEILKIAQAMVGVEQ